MGLHPIIFLKEFEKYAVLSNALVFRGGVLRVQPYPRRAPQEPCGTFRTERIETAARLLSALGRTSGLVPLADALCLGAAPEKGIAANPFCAKAYGPLARLRDGLAHNDVEAVPAEVKRLLGLGIGLTPSADDVLCGMIYTLLHGARKLTAADVEFVNAVRRYAPERTNLISAAILKAVADGGRFEMMDNVLRGLTGAGEDGAQRLLTIGSSSGSERLPAGKMDMDEYNGLIENSWGICGACTSMTTANSMCMIAEALGMTLPGNSTMCATSSSIYNLSYMAGKQIMNLVNEGITARQIITENAIKNAIMLDMAVAASSNLILHIPAIANEAGYDLPWWKYFDEASNEIPLLSHLAPSGPYNVKDFDLAGGMRAMLKELLPKLHGDCLTVTGHTLEENVRDAVVYNRDVIHSLDNPVMTEPGIGVLYGNLAPEGAIVKIAGVPSQLMTYKGKARVFDSLEDGIQALRAGQIHVGDCCVLRFMGLRGRFGTTAFTFQEELKGLHELYNSCAIITDGRFSGGTSGLSIGYVSPEAALGSPLGVIEEGDEVEIDIPARKLHLCISDEEMNRRLAAFHWEFPSKDYPRYLNLFVQNVGSMAKGGIWETK